MVMMNRNEARALEAVAVVCGILSVVVLVWLVVWSGA